MPSLIWIAGYSYRESLPQRIPDKPPYLAHLGNLDYEVKSEDIDQLLEGCEVVSVRLIEDRELRRPKGFGYAEFATVDGLKKALALDGISFQGRNIKIKIADPRRLSPPHSWRAAAWELVLIIS